MKKIYFLLLCCLGLMAQSTLAGNSDLFQVDENALQAKFEKVNALDNFVESNSGVTLSSMVNGENASLLADANLDIERSSQFDAGRLGLSKTAIMWIIIGSAVIVFCVIAYYIFWILWWSSATSVY